MSSNKFLFLKKKKTKQDAASAPFSGFVLEENSVSDSRDSLIHCLIKGLLIFAASFGCISGVLSEFDISYNYLLVLFVLFISSMILSLIHLRKWLFNLGYPVIFLTFTFMLIRYRQLANSGFQALINIINEDYSSHFLMLFTRESTETIADRYLTITAAAIFIGIFLAILINVGIFEEMYFLTTFYLTFLPLQLGIYIGKYPSLLSLILLFFSYFAVYFLKHSGHYYFIYPGKKRRASFQYSRKKKQFVFYKSNARNMVQLCLFALVVSLFFSFFGNASASRSESEASQSGSMKSAVDPYVKIFVQNGISGFFNRYEATGGISNGRLGGISSVRPDYQTDLIVTFVPYAYETVYLKAFVGSHYTSSSWKAPNSAEAAYQYPASVQGESGSSDDGTRSVQDYHEFCAFTESNTLQAMMEAGAVPSMSASMMIENVDAAPNYLYQPYYTSDTTDRGAVTNENILDGSMPVIADTAVTIDYVPYSPSQTDLEDRAAASFDAYRKEDGNAALSTYQTECYNNYLQIPDEIRDDIESYQDAIGTGNNLAEQISLIRQFLTVNYEYDMAPGTTPRDEDFVTYFLGTQKKGYCAHFASAATLLLRSYGIPARYVEGYVITQAAISDRAQATEYQYDDFFEGENILGASNVVEVEVNDGDAHAWVEVYVDGFGWMPVEVTPPSSDDEETTYGDFLSALSGLFGTGGGASQTNGDGTDTQYDDLFASLRFQNSPIIGVFLLILAALLAYPLLSAAYRKLRDWHRRRRAYRECRFDVCISHEYRKLSRLLAKKHPDAALTLPSDVGRLLAELLTGFTPGDWDGNSISDLIALTEKSCFSGKQVSKETADLLIRFYRYSCKRCMRR